MRHPALVFLWILFLVAACQPGRRKALDPLSFLPDSTVLILSIQHPETFRAEYYDHPLLERLRAGRPTRIDQALEALLPLDLGNNTLIAFPVRPDALPAWVAIFEEPGPISADSLDGAADSLAPPVWVLPEGSPLASRREGKWRLVAPSQALLDRSGRTRKEVNPNLHKALSTTNPDAAASVIYPRSPLHPLEIVLSGRMPEPDLSENPLWSAYDLQLKAGELLLQGMEVRPDSLWDNRKLLRGMPVLPLSELTEMVPAGTSSLVAYSLQDPGTFLAEQREIRIRENPLQGIPESTEQLALLEWEGAPLLVLRAINPEHISETLRAYAGAGTEFQGATLYPLQDQPVRDAFEPLLNATPAWTHFARLGADFIFSAEAEPLQNAVSAITRKDTYANNPAFAGLREHLARSGTALAIVSQPAQSAYLADTTAILGLPSRAIKALPDDYIYTAQLNSQSGYDLIEYQFRKEDSPSGTEAGVGLRYTVKLDGKVLTGPFLLKNHRTGGMDLAVQDDKNQLYLFSNTGELFWKKTLSGPIQGSIQQVDLFRNGRWQMAFSVPDKLVVLDRNGDAVRPFPIEFEGGNLGPLAVFDYESNRNYRMVVAQGPKIHMYDGQGRRVTGFKYRDAGSGVIGAAQHFRIGSRDFLIFRLENGRLEIRNRVGDTRVRVRETFSFSDNAVFLYRNTFTFTDRDGNLISIDPAGKITRTPMHLNADHGMFATAKTLSVMNDNILQVRSNRAELELGVYTQPRMFYLNDIIYVAVTDIQSQQLFLFRSTATPLAGFPVEGNGLPDMADMDGDRNPELAVRFRDSAVAVYRMQR